MGFTDLSAGKDVSLKDEKVRFLLRRERLA
jgi:hypothetical protein